MGEARHLNGLSIYFVFWTFCWLLCSFRKSDECSTCLLFSLCLYFFSYYWLKICAMCQCVWKWHVRMQWMFSLCFFSYQCSNCYFFFLEKHIWFFPQTKEKRLSVVEIWMSIILCVVNESCENAQQETLILKMKKHPKLPWKQHFGFIDCFLQNGSMSIITLSMDRIWLPVVRSIRKVGEWKNEDHWFRIFLFLLRFHFFRLTLFPMNFRYIGLSIVLLRMEKISSFCYTSPSPVYTYLKM